MTDKQVRRNDPYLESIVSESHGTATQEEIDVLHSDLNRWRSGLIELLDQAQNSLSYLQANFKDLTRDKLDEEEFRQLQSEMLMKKGKTIRFKRAMEARLRAVNSMIQQENREHFNITQQLRDLCDALLNLFDNLDGIHNDIPPHLHPVLNERLERMQLVA